MVFKLFTLEKRHRKTRDSILSVYFYVWVFCQGSEGCKRASYPKTCKLKFFIVFLHPISAFTYYVLSLVESRCGVIADGDIKESVRE